jgi:hypothetical protein
VPRAPSPLRGVTPLRVVFPLPGKALPFLLRYYGLIRQSSTLPLPPGIPSLSGSLQVVVSPCWVQDLPDVISAILSPRAWTPTPAAPGVLSPVSSSKTLAFPTLGLGRRFALFRANDFFHTVRYFEAAVIRFASGPQICSPLRSSLPQFLVCRFFGQPVPSPFPVECLTRPCLGLLN